MDTIVVVIRHESQYITKLQLRNGSLY